MADAGKGSKGSAESLANLVLLVKAERPGKEARVPKVEDPVVKVRAEKGIASVAAVVDPVVPAAIVVQEIVIKGEIVDADRAAIAENVVGPAVVPVDGRSIFRWTSSSKS
jgi:hypothetical protein